MPGAAQIGKSLIHCERGRKRRVQTVKRRIIASNCRLDHLFDAVVARDQHRVDALHEGLRVGLLVQPGFPARLPCVEPCAVGELVACVPFGQRAEGVGEIGAVLMHQHQQVADQGQIILCRLGQSDLLPKTLPPVLLQHAGHGVDGFGEILDRLVGVGHQRHQRRGQLRHVPNDDVGLCGISVAAKAVDGTEHRVGVIAVHKGAGTVVDGFPGQSAVVGVHDPVDKAHGHPAGDQIGLPFHDGGQQVQRVFGVRIVAVDRVVEQRLQAVCVALRGKDLKGADADMALRHAGQNGAGQGAFADDVLSGADRGQCAGGGDAKGVHRL